MNVGQRVRRLRQERGWSQARLAKEAGMSVPGISYIETGTNTPTAASLLKLSEGLGVGVEEFFPPKARCRSSSTLEQVTR